MQQSKYHRQIATNHEGTSDVYDILHAFNVTNPALAHAIKKLLVPGGRSGGKDMLQDLEEAKWSVQRAIEMIHPPETYEYGLDWFFGMMRHAMATSGRDGWDNPDDCPNENLIAGFWKHVQGRATPDDLADAANYMMMLAYRGQSHVLSVAVDEVFKAATEEVKPNTYYRTDDKGNLFEVPMLNSVKITDDMDTSRFTDGD